MEVLDYDDDDDDYDCYVRCVKVCAKAEYIVRPLDLYVPTSLSSLESSSSWSQTIQLTEYDQMSKVDLDAVPMP